MTGVNRSIIETRDVQLGLSANWRQFALLVVVNGFVGAMVGLERAVLPIVAVNEFGVASTAAVLSFIGTFGLTKAFSNLAAGWLMDRHGRRSILIIGWLLGLPVPILILWAPSWWWIVGANALLGVNQGLAWSATVVMKIDLVGPRRRGFAMGLNESAGYVALAIAAFASGLAATSFGLRTGPAYLGLAIGTVGLLLSWLFVRETSAHVELEEVHRSDVIVRPRLAQLLRQSLWSDRGLFSVSQAGFINNLNDGLAWGVFPLLFVASGLSLREMSAMAAIYPAVWGICQLGTGALSDHWGRRWLIVAGMVMQGIALVSMALTHGPVAWSVALVALGIGTALVYPTLLAAVGDIARPSWRGAMVGVYRLWRDLGYVAGALLAGVIADLFSVGTAIGVIGVMTAVSGVIFGIRFREAAITVRTSAGQVGSTPNFRRVSMTAKPDTSLPGVSGAIEGLDVDSLRRAIQDEYTLVAAEPERGFHFHTGRRLAAILAYDDEWLDALPEATIASFAGTGNPFSLGPLTAGEHVVDVGCGAGIDSIIAAKIVGATGSVIGVDMTPAMVAKAREGANEAEAHNVEFRQGLAESLPVADGWADVVISNGVLNLFPDKLAGLQEMARVLKPGGRLQIGDILVQKAVPANGKRDINLWKA